MFKITFGFRITTATLCMAEEKSVTATLDVTKEQSGLRKQC